MNEDLDQDLKFILAIVVLLVILEAIFMPGALPI